MAFASLPLGVLRSSKRYVEFLRQIAADLPWHYARREPTLGPVSKRVIEQSRLLMSSAICAEDYYNLGLYRHDLSFAEKRTFLGSYQKWRYFDGLNPPVYDVIARDKALFHLFAAANEIPVPETLATTAPGSKPSFGLRLETLDSVKQFLHAHRGENLFFKPADGSLGEGALALGPTESGDRRWIELPLRTPIDVDGVLRHLRVGDQLGRFLIQRRLKPHPTLARVVPDVCSTVRVMTLRIDDEVVFLGAAVRIGSGRSATDNVAGGGLVAPLDLLNGALRQAYCLDSGLPESVERHPLTGASLGKMEVPDWNAIRDLVERASKSFNFLPCIGWDIGITDRGPIVVEINTRPRCVSVQSAATSGLLAGPLGRELAKTSGRSGNGLAIDAQEARGEPQPA